MGPGSRSPITRTPHRGPMNATGISQRETLPFLAPLLPLVEGSTILSPPSGVDFESDVHDDDRLTALVERSGENGSATRADHHSLLPTALSPIRIPRERDPKESLSTSSGIIYFDLFSITWRNGTTSSITRDAAIRPCSSILCDTPNRSKSIQPFMVVFGHHTGRGKTPSKSPVRGRNSPRQQHKLRRKTSPEKKQICWRRR